MALSELEKVASGETILDRTAQFIHRKRFSSLGNQLRSSTKDQFKAEFKTAVEQMVQRLGAESEIVRKMIAVEEVVRQGLTQKGLEVICRNGDSRDLTLVRSVLRTEFVGYSPSYIQYLRAHGEWEDIPLIVGALERADRDLFSLLSSPDEGRYQVAARVLHHVGRSRFPELLALPMPHLLLEYLIALAPDTKFAALSDDSIMRLFQSEHDTVRRVAVLKCIRSLSKARLRRLLKRYLSEDTFYYNVIYWLDFGISVSKERSASAARKTLLQKWPI